MPRDLTRLFFTERAQAHQMKRTGELMSRVRLVALGADATLMPCADVRVSAHIVSNVPVTDNSHDLLYAQPGVPVELQRSATGRLEITGLSKRGTGNIYQYALTVSTGILVSGVTIGWRTRPVTLGELATAMDGGFGYTPLEAMVLINAGGTIVNVIA